MYDENNNVHSLIELGSDADAHDVIARLMELLSADCAPGLATTLSDDIIVRWPSSNIVVTATSPITFTKGEFADLWYTGHTQQAFIVPDRRGAEKTEVAVLLTAAQEHILVLIATRRLSEARRVAFLPNPIDADHPAYVCKARVCKIEGDVITLEPLVLK